MFSWSCRRGISKKEIWKQCAMFLELRDPKKCQQNTHCWTSFEILTAIFEGSNDSLFVEVNRSNRRSVLIYLRLQLIKFDFNPTFNNKNSLHFGLTWFRNLYPIFILSFLLGFTSFTLLQLSSQKIKLGIFLI